MGAEWKGQPGHFNVESGWQLVTNGSHYALFPGGFVL